MESEMQYPRYITLLLVLIFFLACDHKVHIEFAVIVPSHTPDNATIYITGNSDVLGSWDPKKVPLKKMDDTTWKFSAVLPYASNVEFKITLGSWNSQAVYISGQIPENFAFIASRDTNIIIRPMAWGIGEHQMIGVGVTGKVEYHSGLVVEGLNYPKDVVVWLPPGYKNSKERYPVLYMHDGQNVFDPATSFLGIDWQADETADSLIRQEVITGIIIVAISNSPDRREEYSNTYLGKAYSRFLAYQLKPMIDSLYRTKPSREHAAVIGSSMGGLISFLVAWWHPDVFSMAGCLSPAFGYDRAILEEVASFKGGTKSLKLYIDNGTIGLEENLQPGIEEMIVHLKKLGYEENKDLNIFIDTGAVHSESAWAKRLWRPFNFFFAQSN